MKYNPLVSIVMNCHNGEKYLKKSINSIINQTYKNWEVVFWNNNSKDNSKKIFKKFKDKRLRYFESPIFKNLYEARNQAVSKCKGQYICFLDADDWWVKSKVYEQVLTFKKNKKVNFIYSNYYQFNQKFKKKYLFSKSDLPDGKITQQLLDSNKIGIITVMMKRSIFKKQKFDKRFNIIGDFDFFLRLSLNHNLKVIQKPLAYYRIHSSNYSRLHLSKYIKEIQQWIESNEKKFDQNKYSFKRIKIEIYKIRIKKFLSYFAAFFRY